MKSAEPAWGGSTVILDRPIHNIYNTLSLLWQGADKNHSLAFAWWAGAGAGKFPDFSNRMRIFEKPEHKARAIVYLRRNGERDLNTVEASAKALAEHRTAGRKIAVLNISEDTVAQVLAFPKWLAEMEAHPHLVTGGQAARDELNAFIHKISDPVLAWVEAAQKLLKEPVPAEPSETDIVALPKGSATQLPTLK